MEIKKNEKKLIDEYIPTLDRFHISNLPKNNYLKFPYIDENLLKICSLENDYELIEKITNYIIKKKLSNEDFLFIIQQYFIISKEQKSKLQLLLNKTCDHQLLRNEIEIILFNIKYIRFYLIVIEFLFDNQNQSDELYFYLYILIQNNEKEIELYSKKYFKFRIIYYYFQELYSFYKKINKFLCNHKITEEESDKKLFHSLLKVCLLSWYKIYMKDVENKCVDKKVESFLHQKKKNIFQQFLCNHDLYNL